MMTPREVLIQMANDIGEGLDEELADETLARLTAAGFAVVQADEIERLQVQLAGCAVAAVHDETPPLKRDAYGWSASYQEVIDNRHKAEARIAELAAALEQIKKPYPGRDATASIKVMRGIATKALASDGSPAADVLKAADAVEKAVVREGGNKTEIRGIDVEVRDLCEAVARWKGAT